MIDKGLCQLRIGRSFAHALAEDEERPGPDGPNCRFAPRALIDPHPPAIIPEPHCPAQFAFDLKQPGLKLSLRNRSSSGGKTSENRLNLLSRR